MRILVGDIGGTNTTLALVEGHDRRFAITSKKRYRSNDLTGVDQAIDDFIATAEIPKPDLCCLSGAGPVIDGVCAMTNVSWTIRGADVERQLEVKTHIINDFSALCTDQGMRVHAAFENKIVLFKGIRGKHDRPILFTKYFNKAINRRDDSLCKRCNRQLTTFIKIILDHIDDQKRRFFVGFPCSGCFSRQ